MLLFAYQLSGILKLIVFRNRTGHMTSIQRLAKVKVRYLVLATLLLFFIVNYAAYALTIAYDLPEGDHWRWLRGGLIPFLEGDKNFWQFLTLEFLPFSHSHIPTLFEVWLNYHLFGLDYRVESWLGLAGMFAVFYFLCRQYWQNPGNDVPDAAKAAVIISFALVLLNMTNILSWTLVQFENLYLLGTIFYLALADKYFSTGQGKTALLWATLVIFFLGDAMGNAAILSVLGFVVFFSPRREYRLLLQIIVLLVVCTVFSLIFMKGVNPLDLLFNRENTPLASTGNGSGPGIVSYVLANLFDFCKTILMLLSEATNAPGVFRFYFNAWALARYMVGLGVAVFMAVAILSYFYYRKRLLNTALPMLMILFTLASMAGIILTRFQAFGLDIASATRYVRLFEIGLVGALWINSALLVKIFREWQLFWLTSLTAFVCGGILVIGFSMGSYYYWRFPGSVLKNREDIAAAFRQYAEDDSFPVGDFHARCMNHYCRDAIAFLKDNELSLFRH